MRKVALAATVALTLVLSACESGTNTEDESNWLTLSECESMKSPLILTTEFDEYPTSVEVIRTTIKNPTDKDIIFGEPFHLEKLIDEEWRIVPFIEDGGFFFSIANVASANSERNAGLDIHRHFKRLTEGTYRISYITYSQEEPFTGVEPILKFRSNEFIVTK